MKCCLKLTLLSLIWFSIAPRSTRQLSFACRHCMILVRGLTSNIGGRQTFPFPLQSSQELIELLVLHYMSVTDTFRWDRQRLVTEKVWDSRSGLANVKSTKCIEADKQECKSHRHWNECYSCLFSGRSTMLVLIVLVRKLFCAWIKEG